MGDWPPMKPVKHSQEKEKTYLTLVDMFVDVVDPDIIQMVLQNRNWDLDAALEDIMILSTNTHNDKSPRLVDGSMETTKRLQQKKDLENGPIPNVFRGKNIQNSTNPILEYQAMNENSIPYSAKKNVVRSKSQHTEKSIQSTSSAVLPFIEQYNYVKALPSAFDRAVMLIKDSVKVMVLLRGPPGSGKSHLARKMLNEAGISLADHKRHIFSTDDFFVQNNLYVFVPDLLSEAHLWNQRNVTTAVREQVSPIIIDNTNTQAWEMRVYAEIAVAGGYDLEIVEPDTWWFTRENELAKRNVHGVPKSKIRIMLERYDRNITPNLLMQQFNIRYSLSNAPPQPVNKSKWKDKVNSQMNKPKKKKNELSQKKIAHSNVGNLSSKFQSLNLSFPDSWQTQSSSSSSSSLKNDSSFVSNFVPNTNPFQNPMPSKHQLSFNSGEPFVDNLWVSEDRNKNTQLSNRDRESPYLATRKGTEIPSKLPTNHSPVQIPTDHSSKLNPKKKVQDLLSYEEQGRQSQSSFDFLAETNKLLAALGKPTPSTDKRSNFIPSLSEHNILTQEKYNLDSFSNPFIPQPVEGNVSMSGGRPTQGCPGPFGVEQGESIQEKVDNANDLVNSIIDQVVSDEHTNPFEEPPIHEAKDKTEDNKRLWDYALVNGNKTFTYQRQNVQHITNHTNAERVWDYVLVNVDKTYTYQRLDIEPICPPNVASKESVSEMQLVKQEGSCNHGNKLLEPTERLVGHENIGDKLIDFSICGESLDTTSTKRSEQTFDESSVVNDNEINHMSNTIDVFGIQEAAVSPSTADNVEEAVIFKTNNLNNEVTIGNSAVFGMMQDILKTMEPACPTLPPLGKDEMKSSKQKIEKDREYVEVFEKPSDTILFNDWSTVDDNRSDYKSGTLAESFQPKPPRNLTRVRSSFTTVETTPKDQNTSTKFLNWDIVSNPLEHWSEKENPIKSANLFEVLPQRSSRPIKNLTNESATNTNYQDFLLLNDENAIGVKTLFGSCKNINSEHFTKKSDVVETLHLDKGTMTLDSIKNGESFDIDHIAILFPNIPEKYILDMVEKCQGDVNWAVDLLLDSEHSIYTVDNKEEEIVNSNQVNVSLHNPPCTDTTEENLTKHEPKSPNKHLNAEEQAEVKRMIESSVVIGKSHYSDKMLKVLKKRHPDYVNMIENDLFGSEIVSNLEVSKNTQQEEIREEITNESEELTESSSTASFDSENEDNTFELVFNNDLVLQLQQKFGNSNLPKLKNMTSVVALPVALARQLYGYLMDSLQAEMDKQQSAIESTIAQDEEVAKLLHYQDNHIEPQFQEIMDMEIALEVHRAEQAEWREKNQETLAAKVSKNILIEKFPHVDPKVLMEVFHAHNYSLHDSVASLQLAVGESSGATLPPPAPPSDTAQEEEGEAGWAGAIALADPVGEAQSHREEAASYYSLRAECLAKAHEAFRSGNKPVASYYSQLAHMHKAKIERCNSQAAACLLSTHRTGTNTLDLHFLHVSEAAVVLDMFLDETVSRLGERGRRCGTVFLITGRGARSAGGISRIKPMVQRVLHSRKIIFSEVNPGMLSALVRSTTPLSTHS